MSTEPTPRTAEIIAEYGPFAAVDSVHGVTFDGEQVWFGCDGGLVAFDPRDGREVARLDADADAGAAFDGQHLWLISGNEIRKVDRRTGRVLGTIPAPAGQNAGLAYADGALWVGQYGDRKILKLDARTGAVLKTIQTDRFVTGVTFADGELWHGTLGDDPSEIRRVDPESGAVLERLQMPGGMKVSGLEAGGDVFYAGAHHQERAAVRAVRRPRAATGTPARAPRA
jgi:streptogramin lyase